MSKEKTQHKIKAVVTNESGKDVDEAIFDVPGFYDFSGVADGTYEITFTPITNFKYVGQNPIHRTVLSCGCLMITVSSVDIAITEAGRTPKKEECDSKDEGENKSNGDENNQKNKNGLMQPIIIPAIAATMLYLIDPAIFLSYNKQYNQSKCYPFIS